MPTQNDYFMGACSAAFRNDRLRLTILPTEKCNFRCTYCYEDFKLGKMQPETVEGLKNFLGKRLSSLHRLEVGWFGGEPLLAFPIIKEISEFILNKQRHNRDLVYSAGITTNGFLLTRDVLESLVSFGICGFQITLDGDEAEHNRTRVRLGNGTTFEQIWNNIRVASETDLDFVMILRLHYDNKKVRSIAQLLERLNAQIAGDQRFQVHFTAVEKLGGPNDDDIERVSERKKVEIEDFLRSLLSHKIKQYEPTRREPHICYAAEANAWVVRADGRLAKCTVALNDSRNDVGRLNPDGTVSLDQMKHRKWLGGWETGDTSSLSCPYSSMFMAGQDSATWTTR